MKTIIEVDQNLFFATSDCLSSHGDIRVKEICKKTGISRTTFYNRYISVENYYAVFKDWIYSQSLWSGKIIIDSDDLATHIRACLKAIVSLVREQKQYYPVYINFICDNISFTHYNEAAEILFPNKFFFEDERLRATK